MAEAFALIRAVEQKYGPVESFTFRKDAESPSIYQTKVGITFRKIESFNQLPTLPEVFHIRGPKLQSKRSRGIGGIGLDDINPFILGDVEFLTANQVSEMDREERTIDFRIQRADRAHFSPSPFRPFSMPERKRKAIGSKMLQWGGFHPMKPINSTLPITDQDLTKETVDHVYMRRTLRFWADYCKESNPFEFQSEETTKPVSAEPKVTGKTEFEQPNVIDDWFSGIKQSKALQEPMERILEMEDIQFKSTPTEPQAAKLKDSKSLETTAHETTSTVSLDDVSFTTLQPSEQLNPSQATSSEAECTLSILSSSRSLDLTDFDKPQPMSLSPPVTPTSLLEELESEAGGPTTEVELQRSDNWRTTQNNEA
ncbi:hypothetical protein Ac2012v2_005120 [Leucoagaricus gongylophorus]